ncbi:hypothetical protein VX159_00410 [Dechloromonas sp. ZY10]|uniref:hypothetical protein n=1 Tax=Dechloromonas aquae TaxID=2664436 RepID=UPI0035294000
MSVVLVNPFTPAGLPPAVAPFAQPELAVAHWRERGNDPAQLQLLVAQCDALLAARPSPRQLQAWIDTLWPIALGTAEAAAARYVRKPLPLADQELQLFRLSRRLWLGLALLCRQLAESSPEQAPLALQRAGNALRLAVYAHVQAGHAVPSALDEHLFALLAVAHAGGGLALAMTDPLLPTLGAASVGGYLAWAFLWRLVEPQRFSVLQLNVLERVFARWRELAKWQDGRGNDPKARALDLSRFSGRPEGVGGVPHWLDVRSIARKLRQRSDGLRAGETPETLKLGRELSAAACLRLLREVELALAGIRPAGSGLEGEVALVFGAEHIYALLSDQYLNPQKVSLEASRLAHQRLGVFGFDRVSQLSHAVSRLEVPGELWQARDPYLVRLPGQTPVRHMAATLVACRVAGQLRLGCLQGIEMCDDGSLQASLHWFSGQPRAGVLARQPQDARAPRLAAFLLDDVESRQLILPAAYSLRPGQPVVFEGVPPQSFLPSETLERGHDFVRYGLRPDAG